MAVRILRSGLAGGEWFAFAREMPGAGPGLPGLPVPNVRRGRRARDRLAPALAELDLHDDVPEAIGGPGPPARRLRPRPWRVVHGRRIRRRSLAAAGMMLLEPGEPDVTLGDAFAARRAAEEHEAGQARRESTASRAQSRGRRAHHEAIAERERIARNGRAAARRPVAEDVGQPSAVVRLRSAWPMPRINPRRGRRRVSPSAVSHDRIIGTGGRDAGQKPCPAGERPR